MAVPCSCTAIGATFHVASPSSDGGTTVLAHATNRDQSAANAQSGTMARTTVERCQPATSRVQRRKGEMPL